MSLAGLGGQNQKPETKQGGLVRLEPLVSYVSNAKLLTHTIRMTHQRRPSQKEQDLGLAGGMNVASTTCTDHVNGRYISDRDICKGPLLRACVELMHLLRDLLVRGTSTSLMAPNS